MEMLFNREAFSSTLSSQLAGKAVAGLIWAGCIVEDDNAPLTAELPYARPSTVLWMNEDLLKIDDDERRADWYRASQSTKKKAQALMAGWGIATEPWYADNSRETLRDDLFHVLAEYGAMLGAPHLDTTSSKARWILRRDFAELFNPDLVGEYLDLAVDAWIEDHMSTAGRVRATLARRRARQSTVINVSMPDGTVVSLNPGPSSELLQGVIEGWAPLRLKEPAVLTISESGDKIPEGVQALLNSLGITIQVSDLLPDALLVDLGTDPMEFWIVEVVATDGPIHVRRKEKLQKWAKSQGIAPENLRYLTAFLSRHHQAARKSMPKLAPGTFAWFLDEPENELALRSIDIQIPNNVITLNP